jgi:hypothetical protein
MPGWPSRNPGLRPIVRVNRRSKALDASNGVAIGFPYASGSKAVSAASSGTVPPPSGLRTSVAGVPSTWRVTGEDGIVSSMSYRPPAATRSVGWPSIRPGRFRPVPSIATTRKGDPDRTKGFGALSVLTRRSRTVVPADTVRRVVPSRPPSVSIPSSSWATTRRSSDGSAAGSRGSITNAPNSPRATWLEDDSWLWYQNVPVWSARKRYVYEPPGGTASCVTPATPSSAFGTSTPCQWIVTPGSTSRLTSVTSTRSPRYARSTGPGTIPSNVSASTSRPDGRRIVASRATRR